MKTELALIAALALSVLQSCTNPMAGQLVNLGVGAAARRSLITAQDAADLNAAGKILLPTPELTSGK